MFMSNHSNNQQEQCWSCEYFCGERKFRSASFGDSTQTSSNGICSCKRSIKYNKSVSEAERCSKYQKWVVIASAIAKKENQRYEREMQEERRRAEKERKELERERLALEAERERLEYERWYSSLTPEEKVQEDLRVEEERKRREREAEEFRLRWKQEEERARKRKRKNLIITVSLIGAIILLIVGISVGTTISHSIKEKKQRELIYTYILENGEDGVYSKVSGNYAYNLCKGKSYRFNYDKEYEASVTIQKETVELFGIVSFDYGDFSNTAEYYGEIRIDGKSCYIFFEGVKCENKCPEISSPTNCKIVGYSKGWDYSIDANDYLADVWACVRASVTLTQNTIHQWNEDLKLW